MYVQATVQPLWTCWGLHLTCPQQSLKAFNTSKPVKKRDMTFCLLCSFWQMLPNLWCSAVQHLENISTDRSKSPWWNFPKREGWGGILTSLGGTGRTHRVHGFCSEEVASGSTWAQKLPTRILDTPMYKWAGICQPCPETWVCLV